MRTLLLAACAGLILLVSTSAALSMSRRIYSEEEKAHAKAIYKNCKQSLDKKIPPKQFTNTICYAHISGTMEGVSSMGLIYFSGIPESLRCMPNDLSILQYAADYVRYVDRINKGRTKMYYPFPGELLDKIYQCPEKTKNNQ